MWLGDAHVTGLLATLHVCVNLGEDLRSGLGKAHGACSTLAAVLHRDVALCLLALAGGGVVGHVVREVIMVMVRRKSELLRRHGLLVGGHLRRRLGVVVGPCVTRGEGPGVVMVVRAEARHGPSGGITALAIIVEEAVNADHGAAGAVGIDVDGDIEETLRVDGGALAHWSVKDVMAFGAVRALVVVAAVVTDGVGGARARCQSSSDAPVAWGREFEAATGAGVVDVFAAFDARRESETVELQCLVGNAVEAVLGFHNVRCAVGSATHPRIWGFANLDGNGAARAWAAGRNTDPLDRSFHLVRSVDSDGSDQEDGSGSEKSAHYYVCDRNVHMMKTRCSKQESVDERKLWARWDYSRLHMLQHSPKSLERFQRTTS